ncbi:uncharacterized protein LOC122252997 [Penaeus japonicus]|uniref:uncharacterized protein LOC122252997 n=1 Tax=Penaeus japonicus TaxID=27405 RepID=UPI001C712BE3|nr:uncharacterized protein LOC122252997 [Penaeus japonicus]
MGRIRQVICLVLAAAWAGPVMGQEDLLALESSVGGAMAVVPPPGGVDTNMLMPEHRGEAMPGVNIRRQFDVSQPARPPSPARSPFSGIAQQAGEYMRRISDYFYWFLSGSPPITRKKTNVRYQRRPVRTQQHYGKAPIRRQYNQRRQPMRRKLQRQANDQPVYIRGRKVATEEQQSSETQFQ